MKKAETKMGYLPTSKEIIVGKLNFSTPRRWVGARTNLTMDAIDSVAQLVKDSDGSIKIEDTDGVPLYEITVKFFDEGKENE